jgi:uncharacterized protein YjbJ (UPF0337 family)
LDNEPAEISFPPSDFNIFDMRSPTQVKQLTSLFQKFVRWNCACVFTNRWQAANCKSASRLRVAATATKARGIKMNWDQLEGKWKQMKGSVRERWGRLTDDDIEQIAGNRDKFIGLLQERYGLVKEAAERELDQFMRTHPSEAQDRAKAAGRL